MVRCCWGPLLQYLPQGRFYLQSSLFLIQLFIDRLAAADLLFRNILSLLQLWLKIEEKQVFVQVIFKKVNHQDPGLEPWSRALLLLLPPCG